jgi:membrane associated rhomboid family serine protease
VPSNRRPSDEEIILAAHNALPAEQQCVGHYRPSQLITHAFLHGGLLHLAGNLLFLLVLGSRVNALVGNVATVVLYPLLGAVAGLAHMRSVADGPLQPMVGASGAIMGLAGMYLVLLPIHKVHMAAWMRWGLIGGFRLHSTVFAVRGFWVVLFYIAFDVVFTVLAIKDTTAHWAHLGGFIAGAALALLLLVARVVNCRGGDIVSAILGPRAWLFISRPNRSSIRLPGSCAAASPVRLPRRRGVGLSSSALRERLPPVLFGGADVSILTR